MSEEEEMELLCHIEQEDDKNLLENLKTFENELLKGYAKRIEKYILKAREKLNSPPKEVNSFFKSLFENDTEKIKLDFNVIPFDLGIYKYSVICSYYAKKYNLEIRIFPGIDSGTYDTYVFKKSKKFE